MIVFEHPPVPRIGGLEPVERTMRERELLADREHAQQAVERDAAKADENPRLDAPDLLLEKRLAVIQLLGRGLVGGRSAAPHGSNIEVLERQAIAALDGRGLVGKTGAVQGTK